MFVSPEPSTHIELELQSCSHCFWALEEKWVPRKLECEFRSWKNEFLSPSSPCWSHSHKIIIAFEASPTFLSCLKSCSFQLCVQAPIGSPPSNTQWRNACLHTCCNYLHFTLFGNKLVPQRSEQQLFWAGREFGFCNSVYTASPYLHEYKRAGSLLMQTNTKWTVFASRAASHVKTLIPFFLTRPWHSQVKDRASFFPNQLLME